jgi:hypothetical protein
MTKHHLKRHTIQFFTKKNIFFTNQPLILPPSAESIWLQYNTNHLLNDVEVKGTKKFIFIRYLNVKR